MAVLYNQQGFSQEEIAEKVGVSLLSKRGYSEPRAQARHISRRVQCARDDGKSQGVTEAQETYDFRFTAT